MLSNSSLSLREVARIDHVAHSELVDRPQDFDHVDRRAVKISDLLSNRTSRHKSGLCCFRIGVSRLVKSKAQLILENCVFVFELLAYDIGVPTELSEEDKKFCEEIKQFRANEKNFSAEEFSVRCQKRAAEKAERERKALEALMDIRNEPLFAGL